MHPVNVNAIFVTKRLSLFLTRRLLLSSLFSGGQGRRSIGVGGDAMEDGDDDDDDDDDPSYPPPSMMLSTLTSSTSMTSNADAIGIVVATTTDDIDIDDDAGIDTIALRLLDVDADRLMNPCSSPIISANGRSRQRYSPSHPSSSSS